MAKNKISHFGISSRNVNKGIKEVFPEFQLLYNGKALAKYTRFCEGRFRNTGNRDIHSNDDLEFALVFPDGYNIKGINIIPSTEELTIRYEIDKESKNKVHFFIKNLLRVGEEFNYSVLLDSSEYDKSPFGKLRFSNRIPNTSIQDADVKNFWFYLIITYIGLAIFFLTCFFGYWMMNNGLIGTKYQIIILILIVCVIGFALIKTVTIKEEILNDQ